MVYKPDIGASRQGKAILQMWKWGVGIITASVGFGMLHSEIQRVQATIDTPLTIGYLVLFGITGVLILLWISATSTELDLCFEWLDPERYVPPSSIKEILMVAAFGVVLSLLLFAARDPFYYGIVFTLYSAILTYCYHYTKNEICQAIIASRNRLRVEDGGDRALLAAEYRKGLDVLENYFILRPQTTRHVVILLASGVGLAAGLIWKLHRHEAFGILAYGLLAGTIVISEVVLARWRLARDGDLRPIRAEINELARTESSI